MLVVEVRHQLRERRITRLRLGRPDKEIHVDIFVHLRRAQLPRITRP
jgi:hypothetical protein